MKRVTAFVGSARKKNTYQAVVQFLNDLQALGGVEYEIVTLHDYTLKDCRGCEVCIWKGEEFCPLNDDRDALLEKIRMSDGVIFASPTYCGHVSGIMKTFLDRFVFVCHRPRYFGKVCTSIVTYSTYKPDWEIPGGVVELNESPKQCSQREVREELGLDREIGGLLVVDYNSPIDDRTESLMFIFNGGTLSKSEIASFRLKSDELKELRFFTADTLPKEMVNILRNRVMMAWQQVVTGNGVYLEDQKQKWVGSMAKNGLTKRAADGGYAARFLSVFLPLGFIPFRR